MIRRATDTDEVTGVFVGEVKYSDKRSTIRSGVEQLLETVSIARHQRKHLARSGELLQDPVVDAGLFVNESPFSKSQYPDDLAVFEYGDTPSFSF